MSAAVAGTVYLYTIMPRLLHKPDKKAFQTHYFAHRGLHRNGTAMPENSLPAIRKAAEEAGIRDRVKIMVGGAPVTQEFADSIGADAYTEDAPSAAEQALELLAG